MKKLLQISLALATAFGAITVQAQDVKAGEKKIAMCIGCHGIPGYQASFPEVHKVPMIAGQNAKYIVSALQAYAKGDRKHPTMRGIATSLSEQDMNDVAAFYEQQAKLPAVPEAIPAAPANVAELLTKGACVSCHGANFSKPIDPSYPKLAGQHADYLTVALKAYKTEKNNNVGRSNGVMAGQVKQFSNAELKAIASYIGSLPTELATVPQGKFR
ncbi:c-type cytochrome [Roseateles puraquae]|jgi:cytochrome c553|uniref:Cytochrome c4 n=1 Tax=Roseateles puraquae TaxID=431059 RepID=A0A254N6J4_9BURK|nr:c-type cytochrome [Roseateles puraquae]MDG0854257.1 cytochrome c4 [Roseateles puraquae]OWR03625.1 cytochrome c4 [Roseateles puraquae]